MRMRQFTFVATSAILLLIGVRPLHAQVGRLVVHANPREAYVYVDGQAIAESRGHYVCLMPGEHKVDIYNYGFKPETRDVTIAAHKTTVIDVPMAAIPGMVSGPWGDITLEGAPRGAVLLNGQDPSAFFVGHGDEFDNERVWHQELIVPPGKYEMTIQCNCKDPWSTTLEVPANQRVVVDAYKGVRKTVAWSRGGNFTELPKFHAGLVNTQVVVEKVKAELSSTGQINCGDSAHLNWSSSGAAKTELDGAPVSAAGDQTIQPKQTTNYKLVAMGPGGVSTADATVNVNNSIPVSFNVTPAEVNVQNSGQGTASTATVTWSAPNADNVTVDPLGSVGASGSRQIPITSPNSSGAPVDQTVTYTLHATNACGGSETRTASLHITAPGVLQGATNTETTLESKLNINSVYFPTDWPTVKDPESGLVPSEASRVEQNGSDFKQYLSLHPDAKLTLEAYCDVRASVAYNQALAERRAAVVKNYLVEHGIPADQIETRAYGKTRQLTEQQVTELANENPNMTPDERKQVLSNMVIFEWANNRRVDIRLSPTNQVSQRYYPVNAADLNVLMEQKEPAPQTASIK